MARAKTKGTSLFVKLVLIALIIYLSYLCIDLRIKISDKKSQNTKLDTQISYETDRNKQLDNENKAELSEEFIIDRAHEEGYGFEGEKIYESIS